MTEVEKKARAIIGERLGVKDFANESKFSDDLGADSLDQVELVMEFEKQFLISIDDSDAESFVNVGDVISYLERTVKI